MKIKLKASLDTGDGYSYKEGKVLEVQEIFEVSGIVFYRIGGKGFREDKLNYVIVPEATNFCIFEKRRCKYANKVGDVFSCEAKSDEDMTCNNS